MEARSLGLKHGNVELVEHDERWAQAFQHERAILAELLAGLSCQIEHVGSTAVGGLPAKPILDIAIGVPTSVDMNEVIRRLKAHSLEYRGDKGAAGGQLFIRAHPDVVTHHMHCVTLGDPQWQQYLATRELLSRDQTARRLYATAKRELAARFRSDRTSYRQGKGEVLDRLLSQLGGVSEPDWGSESAIIVPILDVPAIISELRKKYAEESKGVPPHVTLLYPFASPPVETFIERVGELFEHTPAFRCTFTAAQRFGNEVLWLSPEPSWMFIELIQKTSSVFPEYPPYGGDYDDITPHMTVAYSENGADLGAVEKMVAPVLPIMCSAKEAWLIAERVDGNWTKVAEFPFRSVPKEQRPRG